MAPGDERGEEEEEEGRGPRGPRRGVLEGGGQSESLS